MPDARRAPRPGSRAHDRLLSCEDGNGGRDMADTNAKDFSNPETILGWRCIGCGRIEVPGNCIGVCEDRKVELVGAWDYAEVAIALEGANERIAALESLLGKLAHITPRERAWKDSYLALQARARKLLAPPDSGHAQ